MERIQSAIAKARAARERRIGTGSPGGSSTATGAAPGMWETLPEVSFAPKLLARNRIVTRSGGPDAMPFDILRTRLMRELSANGWRRVVVTSPLAGCGKTTLCANLSLSLARQPAIRTVLAELDLRRPALARMLGIAREVQFAAVLDGSGELSDHLLRHGDNLCLALNSSAVRNPGELLQGRLVASVIERMEKRLAPDVMLFDMPPALSSDDTLAFLDKADCALIVAAAETTTSDQIDQCERELARHTNVLGIVLNKLRDGAAEEGYGY